MKFKNNKYLKQIKNITSYKIDVSNLNIFNFKEGWNIVKDLKTNKRGWINENYTQIINPIFDECWQFKEGFAIFKRDDKYGWINSEGIVLTEGFDCCYDFQEGFAIFEKNDKEGWVDKNGKIIAEGFDNCFNFKKDFAIFEKDGKQGWIDKNGKIYTENPY